METPILLSFIKEISAEVEIQRIRRFLSAFLSNFFKGYVKFDVFVGDKESEGDIIVSLKKNKDYLLEVEDTGPGIEKEYIDRIFEPFFTRKEKGAGLGLSFVKKVIEGHGFKIGVLSIIGKGAKFIIEIPEKFIKGSNP